MTYNLPPPPSRAVIVHKKGPAAATPVHRAGDPDERRRIESLGGSVSNGRVGGEIEPSRGFGDYRYKVRRRLFWLFFSHFTRCKNYFWGA